MIRADPATWTHADLEHWAFPASMPDVFQLATIKARAGDQVTIMPWELWDDAEDQAEILHMIAQYETRTSVR